MTLPGQGEESRGDSPEYSPTFVPSEFDECSPVGDVSATVKERYNSTLTTILDAGGSSLGTTTTKDAAMTPTSPVQLPTIPPWTMQFPSSSQTQPAATVDTVSSENITAALLPCIDNSTPNNEVQSTNAANTPLDQSVTGPDAVTAPTAATRLSFLNGLSEARRPKEALACLAKELVRRPLTRKRVRAEEAAEPVRAAAVYALLAYPDDVVRMLVDLSKNILRRTGPVTKGRYPANMPLVLACLVDRIVMLERQQGGPPRFESCLGPVLHILIFSRWSIGVVPGSQFLANLLFTWERLGYFKGHLHQSRKTLWLLMFYARTDGIPDPPHKDKGTGWYRIVSRAPGNQEGTEAIGGKLSSEQPKASKSRNFADISQPRQMQPFKRLRGEGGGALTIPLDEVDVSSTLMNCA